MFTFLKIALAGLLVPAAAVGTTQMVDNIRERPHAPAVAGEVIEVNDDSLLVATDDAEMVVLVGDETRIAIAGVVEPELDDIKTGDRVRARGRFDDSGALAARVIRVVPDGERVTGRLTALEGNMLTLTDREGSEQTVYAADDTVVVVPGRGQTTWGEIDSSQIPVGRLLVAAFGERNEDGSLDATVLIGHRPHRRAR